MTRPPLMSRIFYMARLAVRLHGFRLPLVLVQRTWLYLKLRCLAPKTFEFSGKTYHCHFRPYSLDNERAAEIALAEDFLKGQRGEILEVGNVLSHYLNFQHDVVDKYEQAPGVINEDIVTYAPGKKYDCIMSVSTLEHVGWDEQPRDPQKIIQAIQHLKTLLKDGAALFVTMPLGYNPHVDEMIRTRQTGFPEAGYLLRISADNGWREASWEEVQTAKYATPFPCANALFVGIFRQPSGNPRA